MMMTKNSYELVLVKVLVEIRKAVATQIKKTAKFGIILKRLDRTLTNIEPIMYGNNGRLSRVLDRPENETKVFVYYLEKGKELVLKCSRVKCWDVYKKFVHANRLIRLDREVLRFFQGELQDGLSTRLGSLALGDEVVSTVTKRAGGFSSSWNVPGLPDVVVGLDSHLTDNTEIYCQLTQPEALTTHQRRQYPSHDIQLAHYLETFTRHQEEGTNMQLSNKFTAGITEILPEPDEDGLPETTSPTQLESPNNQTQDEFSEDLESGPSMITRDGHHTTRQHPKIVASLLGVYVAFCGFILFKLTRENHATFSHSTSISFFAFALAFMVICIMFWIYEHIENDPNSSRLEFYLGCYDFLYTCYIVLLVLAIILILPQVFTPQH